MISIDVAMWLLRYICVIILIVFASISTNKSGSKEDGQQLSKSSCMAFIIIISTMIGITLLYGVYTLLNKRRDNYAYESVFIMVAVSLFSIPYLYRAINTVSSIEYNKKKAPILDTLVPNMVLLIVIILSMIAHAFTLRSSIDKNEMNSYA